MTRDELIKSAVFVEERIDYEGKLVTLGETLVVLGEMQSRYNALLKRCLAAERIMNLDNKLFALVIDSHPAGDRLRTAAKESIIEWRTDKAEHERMES